MRKTLRRTATLLTKKAVLFVVVLFMSITIRAYDIEVKNSDGVTIFYNYINNGTELEVTGSSKYNVKYSGTVVIPEEVTDGDETLKVTGIGAWAFNNCTNLVSVTIPHGVTSIGNFAFSGCTDMTSLTIPNSVTSIGNWAFNHCDKMTAFDIPNGVTSIEDETFANCKSLISVSIPNSVTSIGTFAFLGWNLFLFQTV